MRKDRKSERVGKEEEKQVVTKALKQVKERPQSKTERLRACASEKQSVSENVCVSLNW